MSYREHAPAKALAPWIECAWERSGEGGAPVRVLPDGCIDIVWIEGTGAQVVGPNTTAFLVSVDPGVRVVGVRMHPGAAPPLLGIDAAELRDGRVALAEVWQDDGRELEACLTGGPGDVATLLAHVGARARGAEAPDRLVRAAVERLHDPAARVESLARDLDVSARQLRRRFEAAVGYGPKRLGRVLRLQRALGAAHAGSELARAAAGAGYADQAHFAHECRALAGVSPRALAAA